MVLASKLVDSDNLFAALPVGAQRAVSTPMFFKSRIKALTMVVFPVPGPPVITVMPKPKAP